MNQKEEKNTFYDMFCSRCDSESFPLACYEVKVIPNVLLDRNTIHF